MIDRVLNFGPVQQDSYYFQLIPISLAIVTASDLPAKDTTYKFTVSKGTPSPMQEHKNLMRIRFPLRPVSKLWAEGLCYPSIVAG